MSNRPRKALIIGAGIAGPVTAILLRRAGIERDLRGLALFERYRRRPPDRTERHACAGRDRARERADQPRLDRRILRLLFAERRTARLDQPRHGAALRPAGRQCLPRHAERNPDRQGLVRLRLALFREAPDQDRGPRRPADHRLLLRRHHGRRRLPDRRRRRALGRAPPGRAGRSATVRHRADRVRRLRAARRPRWQADRPARRDHVRQERLLRLRLLQPGSERRRDVVEHAARARHGRDDVPRARPPRR